MHYSDRFALLLVAGCAVCPVVALLIPSARRWLTARLLPNEYRLFDCSETCSATLHSIAAAHVYRRRKTGRHQDK